MNKTLTMLTLTAIIFSVTALVPAETLVPQEKGELILKFKMGTPSSCMHEILRAYGLTILDEVSKLNILIVSVSKNKMATIMDC